MATSRNLAAQGAFGERLPRTTALSSCRRHEPYRSHCVFAFVGVGHYTLVRFDYLQKAECHRRVFTTTSLMTQRDFLRRIVFCGGSGLRRLWTRKTAPDNSPRLPLPYHFQTQCFLGSKLLHTVPGLF